MSVTLPVYKLITDFHLECTVWGGGGGGGGNTLQDALKAQCSLLPRRKAEERVVLQVDAEGVYILQRAHSSGPYVRYSSVLR